MSKQQLLTLLLVVVCPPGSADEQRVISTRDVPVRQRAVDVLILNDSARLLGVRLPQQGDADVTRMLFRTSWLKDHASGVLEHSQPLSDNEADDENPATLEALLHRHVDKLQQQPNVLPERLGFLQQRLAELQDHDDDEQPPPKLTVVLIANELIRRQLSQSQPVQHVGFLGILNDIEDVESLSRRELTNRLRQIPVAKRLRQIPDNDLPSGDYQFRRLLVATDHLFGTTCKLIRWDGKFIADENAGDEEVAALAMKMLTQQAQSQLQQLFGEALTGPSAAQSEPVEPQKSAPGVVLPLAARSIAEQQQADMIEITEMKLDIPAGTATVRVCLFHHDDTENAWTAVGCVTESAASRDAGPEDAQHLADNPQLKSVLSLFTGLGASTANVSKALSMGAVVRIAQQKTITALNHLMHEAQSVTNRKREVMARRLDTLPETAE